MHLSPYSLGGGRRELRNEVRGGLDTNRVSGRRAGRGGGGTTLTAMETRLNWIWPGAQPPSIPKSANDGLLQPSFLHWWGAERGKAGVGGRS